MQYHDRQERLAGRADLTVHGWIYGIRDGILKSLVAGISAPDQVDESRRG